MNDELYGRLARMDAAGLRPISGGPAKPIRIEHHDDEALIEAMATALADFMWADPAIGFTVKRGEIARLMKGGALAALVAYRAHMREQVVL